MVRLIVNFQNSDENAIPAVSDYKVNDLVEEIIDRYYNLDAGPFTINTTQAVVVLAIRVAVVKQYISYQDIQFQFNGEIIQHNRYAKLAKWPDNFCNIYNDLLNQ